jgi:hypothetical protein
MGSYPGFRIRVLRRSSRRADLLSSEGVADNPAHLGLSRLMKSFGRFAESGIISECAIVLPANHANHANE